MFRPWQKAVAIAGLAVLLRIGIFTAVVCGTPIHLPQYTAKGDTSSYIAVASAMCRERTFDSLDDYDRRVFPGYPALIALLHLARLPLPLAALVVTWIAAGTAAGVVFLLFEDVRIALAMVCLVPHYLINSSIGMSESVLLAVTVVSVMLARCRWPLLAGLTMGFAGLVRPMACFAGIGVGLMLLREHRRADLVRFGIGAAALFLTGAFAMHLWTGSALHGVQVYARHPGAYAGHLVVWPFRSLWLRQDPVTRTPAGRMTFLVYIGLHLLLVLTACWIAVEKTAASRPPNLSWQRSLLTPWLVGNTIFVLCIGPPWGFIHFPRFIIPAEPALWWVLRHWLPKSAWVWALIITACLIFAIFGVIDSA